MSSTDIAKLQDMTWYAEVPRSIRKQSIAGIILLILCFGGFGIWASFAPLAAAVISQGSFVATGQNKIVQHLEGGVIKEILVSEGDHITAGQPLLQLDETSALANERQLFLRRARLLAIVARLSAEYQEKDSIDFPAELSERMVDPEVAEILDSQKLNFTSSKRKLNSEIELLNNNIAALEIRGRGYEAQHEALTRQLAFLSDEFSGKQKLYEQGLMRKPEISAIKRAMAEAEGRSGALPPRWTKRRPRSLVIVSRPIRHSPPIVRRRSTNCRPSKQNWTPCANSHGRPKTFCAAPQSTRLSPAR